MMLEKMPIDADSEKALLSCFMQDGILYSEYADRISGESFTGERLYIYKALKDAAERGELQGELDTVNFVKEMHDAGTLDKAGGLIEIQNIKSLIPSTTMIEKYVSKVEDAAGKRNIYAALLKGFNELQKDSASLHEIKAIIQNTLNRQATAREKGIYNAVNRNDAILGFFRAIESRREYYPTGIKCLDSLLDGGIYAGLFVIGAIPSLGKTSFILQIADNIAAGGCDVLLFSLEMSRHELTARTYSRLTAIAAKKRDSETIEGALTAARILSGSLCDVDKITDAVKADTAGEHIFISQGVGNIGYKEIRAAVEYHKAIRGVYPVVMVDYMQILAPEDEHATDKQNIDKAAMELKRLSRDTNRPVILVSSFNRENYNAPVSMASFKESGSIEYSADVLIGLQYAFMELLPGESGTGKDSKRAARITQEREKIDKREEGSAPLVVEAKILKNRAGRRGRVFMGYYPEYNWYIDSLPVNNEKYKKKIL